MSILENFPELVGFYALDAGGALGVYGEAGDFVVDKPTTEKLSEHITTLLTALNSDSETSVVIGNVFPISDDRPWSSPTLKLNEDIVHKLYPIGGSKGAELTTFQKKNQERSIFQGIELLLDYHDSSMPTIPIYCPILIAGTKGSILVVNLLEKIPVSVRDKPELIHLLHTIRSRVIKTQRRKKTSALGLMRDEDLTDSSDTNELSSAEAFANIDKRGQRELLALFNEGSATSYAGWLEQHSDSETFKRITSFLSKPYDYPEPGLLKKFHRFNEWDLQGLSLIASRNPIFKAPAGTLLLERGTIDMWNLYLIDGELEVKAEDGATKIIEGGTGSASGPVSYLKPRLYSAKSVTEVTFLWLYDPLIEALYRLTGSSE